LGLARPLDPGNLGLDGAPDPRNMCLVGASIQVTWVWKMKMMSYPKNSSLARPQELGRGTTEL